MRTVALVATCAGFLWMFPVASVAGTSGELTGTVTDGAHRPLAGAKVVAQSPAQATQTTTDAAGRFAFVSLQPGTYDVFISCPGFQDKAYFDVVIRADYQSTLAALLVHRLRMITIDEDFVVRSVSWLVRPGVTPDVYQMTRYSMPFYDFGDQGTNPLEFVPGVQFGPGLVLAN